MTPIAAVIPDVVFLFEQINLSPGTWYAAIDEANTFLLVPVHGDHQTQLALVSNISSIPLQFYIKDMLILQPWIIT